MESIEVQGRRTLIQPGMPRKAICIVLLNLMGYSTMNVTSRLDFDVVLTPPPSGNLNKKGKRRAETEILNANARKRGGRGYGPHMP